MTSSPDERSPLDGLQVVTEGSALSWFSDAIPAAAEPGTLGSLVPNSFYAYVRVLHPAYRHEEGTTVEVRWSEVAAANGAEAHPDMQWPSITGSWRYIEVDTQPGLWDSWPERFTLTETLAARLARTLEGFTSSPAKCNFAVWKGFPLLPLLASAPWFELRRRRGEGMVLLTGQLSSASRNLAYEPWTAIANLWWPQDRSWFAYTGLDLSATFVGGSEALVEALLGEPGLEAYRVGLRHRLAWDSDPVNPAPPRD